jgi:hypothetical protein
MTIKGDTPLQIIARMSNIHTRTNTCMARALREAAAEVEAAEAAAAVAAEAEAEAAAAARAGLEQVHDQLVRAHRARDRLSSGIARVVPVQCPRTVIS